MQMAYEEGSSSLVQKSSICSNGLPTNYPESQDKRIYCPSDYCYECISKGKKCVSCESHKQLQKVVSYSNFQEGPKKKKIKPSYICTLHCKYDIIRQIASKMGMRESMDNWNVFWSDFTVSCERVKNLKRYQKVNHFPGMIEICRKDLLARNLNRMYKTFPTDYDFFPKTWLLPTDYADVIEFAKSHKNKTYILKPDIGCKGKGILLTKNPRQMAGLDRTICQIYVSKPYLINGFKFDLRVYTLLTSCDPLRLYVYNEGLVRFATKHYIEPNKTNITNMYMHLTNYSVNKFSRTYLSDPDEGSKRKLTSLNETLRKQFHDVKKLWKDIDDVIIKTVFLALPTLQHNYRAAIPSHNNGKACFEILGFDLILDHRLKPYLLEVNHSPSFHTDAPIDREVKESLLVDTFKILNLTKNTKNKVILEDRKTVTNRLLKDLTLEAFPKSLSALYMEHRNSDNTIILVAFKRKSAHKGDNVVSMYSLISHSANDNTAEDFIRKIDAFEMENKGNFRRIYPNEYSDKYSKFYCQGTSSLFNDTFASRAREKATKLIKENQEANNEMNKPWYKSDSAKSTKKDMSFEWIVNKIKKETAFNGKMEEKMLASNNFTEPIQDRMKTSMSSPFVNSASEEKRIMLFHDKHKLLESVGVLEKIHSTMKTFGQLQIRNEIQKVRKNKWSQYSGNMDKRISLQHSLSHVIKHIDSQSLSNIWQT